jgi:hypothetical protein
MPDACVRTTGAWVGAASVDWTHLCGRRWLPLMAAVCGKRCADTGVPPQPLGIILEARFEVIGASPLVAARSGTCRCAQVYSREWPRFEEKRRASRGSWQHGLERVDVLRFIRAQRGRPRFEGNRRPLPLVATRSGTCRCGQVSSRRGASNLEAAFQETILGAGATPVLARRFPHAAALSVSQGLPHG